MVNHRQHLEPKASHPEPEGFRVAGQLLVEVKTLIQHLLFSAVVPK